MSRVRGIALVLVATTAIARASAAPAENPLAKMADSVKRSTAQFAAAGERTQRHLARVARDLRGGWDALAESDQVRLARELWSLRHHIRLLDYLQNPEAWERIGLRRDQIVALQTALRTVEAQRSRNG
ncbi:MAG: hypothetical protein SFX74_09380 [Fimbriimonadaceae bacterium]|nr:hypothetical protein [Fimbriimonadaceae bacterium]